VWRVPLSLYVKDLFVNFGRGMRFAPFKTGYTFCPMPNCHTSQVEVQSSCPECPSPPYLCIVFCIVELVAFLNIHVPFSLNADQQPTNQSINHIDKNVILSLIKHYNGDKCISKVVSRRNDMRHLYINSIIAIIM
jgi:hypothetical protein